MTELDEPAPLLHHEPGSSWWPVLWGPVFALLGLGLEALTGPVNPGLWAVAGAGLALAALVWVQGRRRVCAVRLTPFALQQGREVLPLEKVAAVRDVEMRAGARVLGGGYTPPRGTTAVPLRLVDGSVVVGWARDPDGLRDALAARVEPPE